jgi:hypothetical protein
MNVAAVFAPKKVYGCSGYQGFNCDLKIQRAAATRTRLTDAGRLHGVPPWLGAIRRRNQIVPIKNAVCAGVLSTRHNILLAASDRFNDRIQAEVDSDHRKAIL